MATKGSTSGPKPWTEMYADVAIPDPPLSEPAFFEALPEFLKDASLNRVRWYWRFDTPEKAQHMTRGYLRMISGVDAAIGRVLDELESLELASNTVVILMGDNGYFLGERGYAGKWLPPRAFDPRAADRFRPTEPREESRGTLPSMPVLNIDISPTLLDLAGVEIPSTVQGASLVPILRGASPDGLAKRLLGRASHGESADPQTRGCSRRAL